MSKNYLIHYASKYYDPVKAHEYYMKNRELKGDRTKSNNTSDVVKNPISNNPKNINLGNGVKATVNAPVLKNPITESSKPANNEKANTSSIGDKVLEVAADKFDDYVNRTAEKSQKITEKVKGTAMKEIDKYIERTSERTNKVMEATNTLIELGKISIKLAVDNSAAKKAEQKSQKAQDNFNSVNAKTNENPNFINKLKSTAAESKADKAISKAAEKKSIADNTQKQKDELVKKLFKVK